MKAADSPDAFKHGKKSDSSTPPLNPNYKVGINKKDTTDKSVLHGGAQHQSGDCSY